MSLTQLPPDLLLLRFPGPNLGHLEPRARLQPDTEPDARPHRGYFTLGPSGLRFGGIRAPLNSPQHARSELVNLAEVHKFLTGRVSFSSRSSTSQ